MKYKNPIIPGFTRTPASAGRGRTTISSTAPLNFFRAFRCFTAGISNKRWNSWVMC